MLHNIDQSAGNEALSGQGGICAREPGKSTRGDSEEAGQLELPFTNYAVENATTGINCCASKLWCMVFARAIGFKLK